MLIASYHVYGKEPGYNDTMEALTMCVGKSLAMGTMIILWRCIRSKDSFRTSVASRSAMIVMQVRVQHSHSLVPRRL